MTALKVNVTALWARFTSAIGPLEFTWKTAREYLVELVNDTAADAKLRLDAAKRLIEFEEPKPAPMGKKEARAEAAKKVGSKFAPTAAPKLAAVNGSRVG